MMMSEEMTVKLHRMMWSSMQRDLGDNPSGEERIEYKERWIRKHFPGAMVHCGCFLCEFTQAPYSGSPQCKSCPIKWPHDSCTFSVHYQESPISKILALPARNEKIEAKRDETALVRSYYNYREELLSKASGRPASTAIDDHVKAIQEKAVEEKAEDVIYDFLYRCEKYPDTPINERLKKKLCAIQEKAVEDYFKKTPGAKLATMDVDQAFKQYADEQKAPIFRALAEASGLSAGNESVKAHISEIKDKAKNDGRFERSKEIFKNLSVHSGVTKDDWSVYDHAMAIKRNASNEKELGEARKELNCALGSLNLYRSTLSYESNLPSSAPIAAHINRIREYAFTEGKRLERERIMNKIKEVLNQ